MCGGREHVDSQLAKECLWPVHLTRSTERGVSLCSELTMTIQCLCVGLVIVHYAQTGNLAWEVGTCQLGGQDLW